MLRRAKRNYYNDLDLSHVRDNRKFWKTIRPPFTNKIKVENKITLNEDSKSTKDDQQVDNIFNSFVVNTASSLKISYNKSLPQNRDISKLVEHAIKNFENHNSIIAIKTNRNPNDRFSFKPVKKEMIEKEISNLKSGKAVRSNDIPTKIIKDFKDLFATFIYNNCNKCLLHGTFPEDLKTAEVVPVHKKKKRTDKNNCRPVSILSNISKIYERSFSNQMYDYFDSIFLKYQCGFRKGHIPQHCLLYMTQKIKQARDNNNLFAAVLTDLSKAFDCINHELLIAKLNAYGFDSPSLKFVPAYLNFRKQKTKVASTFSVYVNILFGVSQGCIAGPLFFNVYTCDMFFLIDSPEFSSYADDNTPFVSAQNHEKLIKSLQGTLNGVFEWYQVNYFKASADKYHLLLSPFSNKEMTLANDKIASSNSKSY